MTPGARDTMPSMAVKARRFAMLVGLPAMMLLTAGEAHATNGECEEIRMALNPIYQQLIAALDRHLYSRDINMKIDAETDTWAQFQFRDMADRHDKMIVNLIREYNDGDPVAIRKCNEVVYQADCEAFQVYKKVVIDLPGMAGKRQAIMAENDRRCAQARGD